jgi:uncharacterized pyridoxal phosphate-containing UPF0001 family protein
MARAARAAGRDPAELTLIAVSKKWPPSDVAELFRLGVTHFAENREQEGRQKAPAVDELLGAGGRAAGGAPLPRGGGPVWHFVGQLQRNKVNHVVRWAGWVHSVDRASLVWALSRAAVSAGRRVDVCVQVSLDPPESAGTGRGGADPAAVAELAALVASCEGLTLAGVMAVAPRGLPPRPAFAKLRAVAETLQREHPEATVISAGMSDDLEAAVVEGATHLRIGTALFGARRAVP